MAAVSNWRWRQIFIVCADNASFALPEAKLGIVPDSGGVLRLPKDPAACHRQ
ncbi:enoyl-CoA hydratase-related protein [Escherichia coli]